MGWYVTWKGKREMGNSGEKGIMIYAKWRTWRRRERKKDKRGEVTRAE